MQRKHWRYALAGLLIGALSTAGLAASQKSTDVDASRHERNRFWVRQDANVMRKEPGSHEGTGQTTAYRYFDDVKDARVIFRKRAMHKGSSIGWHVQKHDEVYYVVSGRGELKVDDRTVEVGPSTAIFMHEGAQTSFKQLGEEDLVIIIAYPPAEAH